MSRWFRFYDEALDDPKVQRLPGDLFKVWVNLLCIASRNDGLLPAGDDLAFLLRLDADAAQAAMQALCERGLIDAEDGEASPHNWSSRQFQSDKDATAAERQARKRNRDRERDVTGTVTRDITRDITDQSRGTSRPPEAEADTEAEQQSRAEAREPEPPRPAAAAEGASRRGELDKLTDRLCEAAGIQSSQAGNMGFANLSPILGLMDAGYSLDEDILPVLRTRRGKGKPISWSYFVDAIRDAREKRAAAASVPAPKVLDRRDHVAVMEAQGWRRTHEHFAMLCKGWFAGRTWPPDRGPKPGEPGSFVPQDFARQWLAEHRAEVAA